MKFIKLFFKKLIEILPLGVFFLKMYKEFNINRAKKFHHKNLFTSYYKTNYWGCAESFSGSGSTLLDTEVFRADLGEFLDRRNVRLWLDAPCGDYNWAKYVKRPKGLKYIGGEIVDTIVSLNNKKYSDKFTRFISLDITRDKLPKADIWLCRDCLLHFSYDYIFKSILTFLNSEIPLWLVSTYPSCERNRDIAIGDDREVNLERGPFSFPAPLEYLKDGGPRVIGVWSKESLTAALKENQEWQEWLLKNANH